MDKGDPLQLVNCIQWVFRLDCTYHLQGHTVTVILLFGTYDLRICIIHKQC